MVRLAPSRRILSTLGVAAVLCSSAAGVSALAQSTNTGTIVGTVTDASGAVVKEAKVTVKDTATNTTRETVTNGSGQFVLVNVTPSHYSITVTKDGFSAAQIVDQTVAVGSQATANFQLMVGAASTTIDVQATGADLQTLNSAVGNTVNAKQIDALPNISREVSTFATLQPAVTPGGSVAGTVSDQATFQLDGGNNTSDMDGSMQSYTGAFGNNPTGITALGGGASGVMPMPADSVEEFKVNTVNQTADFNNASGSQVAVVTKRGTDNIHGTVYEYYLDSNMGANTWQNNNPASYTPKASYHYNRFGAAAGGPVLPQMLGGKTYLFGNYEGFKYPNAATYEKVVPSANMRQGILSYNGTNYNMAAIDPRHIGINPVIQKMWTTYLPAGNDPKCGALLGDYCDGVNTVGFKANVSIPQSSNFAVARIDHDFGSKWHFMSSYRYYNLRKTTANQVDIGGFFPGDTLGVPKALSQRPQVPWFYVAQLTTNITSNTTNDFHYSFLRNGWTWATNNAPPQAAGLGGALEPMGENQTSTSPYVALTPYNVDTSNIRTRLWDGKDHFVRDDLTMLKGNHLIQFGGEFQHNFDYHQRSDNGNGINFTPTYQMGDTSGVGNVNMAGLIAAGYPSSTGALRTAAATLGIVTESQVTYTRSGNNLALLPALTPASDYVTTPFYNVYFTDTWHMQKSLTVNYGLGWALEMPPTEQSGKQVDLVDAADNPIKALDYMTQRKNYALQGQVYNPTIGYALVGNVGAGRKYPFNPFYGQFSPRLSVAWNPNFGADTPLGRIFGGSSTVIRAGYGRVYGRLNGVGMVLLPLLGPGLLQPVQCTLALASGACGPATPTDTTGFRIGTDGSAAPLPVASTTLPQPLFPGYNQTASATASVFDPNYRPNTVDSFNLTVQRQVSGKMLIEAGYIGRLIHNELQAINLNAVPYMMTINGQSFASAYAAIETAMGCATSAAQCIQTTANANQKKIFPSVSAQPFFEGALNPAYCVGYANCTTAVLQKQISNLGTQKVWTMWSALDNGAFNFSRSMMNTPIAGQANGSSGQMSAGVSVSTPLGYGNYHAGFVSMKLTDFHGLTAQENFTYSKALGTGAVAQSNSIYTPDDPFNESAGYGLQQFNQKFIFNTIVNYDTPWFKGEHGLIGRAAGGWNVSAIFAAGSGTPLYCYTNTTGQSFGAADGSNFVDNEQCVFTSKYTGGVSTHRNVSSQADSFGNVVGSAGYGVNMFANPAKVFDQVRAPMLGIDTKNPGYGPISGLPYWNMDLSIRKNLKIYNRFNLEVSGIFTNVFNHLDFANPAMKLTSPTTWGVVTSQGNNPRQIQMGARANF